VIEWGTGMGRDNPTGLGGITKPLQGRGREASGRHFRNPESRAHQALLKMKL
jgi:hypothetical protein